MLHGGGPGASGWSNYKQNIPGLAARFRLLIVDQPGFGRTDKPEHDEPQHELTARLILGLLDQLGIERVTPVGNSMGGAASLELALTAPDRVDRLILMAPAGGSLPIFTGSPTAEGMQLVTFSAPPGPTIERMRALISALTYDSGAIPEQTVTERFAAATEPAALAYNARMFHNWVTKGLAPDHWRRIDQITHHTLLLWGREDRVLPLDSAMHMLRHMPNARLHVFPRCGHWCMVEARAEFEAQIKSFMHPGPGA
jgi:pimeloyl-ACP methyl ester carboxylesterase